MSFLRHSLSRLTRRRQFHSTLPHRDSIDWKGPLRTLGIRNPYSLAAGGLALTFFLTFPFWFKQPYYPSQSTLSQNDDLPAPVRGSLNNEPPRIQSGPPPSKSVTANSAIDDPVKTSDTSSSFPDTLELDGDRFRLVAWGVRTVSFLRVQVYNVGLYVPESQYAILPTYALSDSDSDPWPSLIRIFSVPLLLRITPVRNTDYTHLRDGFIRSTMSRLDKYDEGDERKAFLENSVTTFKTLFPKSKLKKGEILTIVQKGPELRLYHGHRMEESLGSVKNDDLARGLMSAYLVGDKVISPDLQKKLRAKVLEIADI
jgi:Chalcone isomerase like